MTEPAILQDVMDLIGDMNTKVVGDYFESRGFVIESLDTNDIANPPSDSDWLVQNKNTSFICEVKTINSVKRGTKNTQSIFRKKFENRVRGHFSRKKNVRDLPYHLHFHSDTLSIPDDKILNNCLKSIGQTLLDISAQEEVLYLQMLSGICNGAYDLTITPSRSGSLEIQVSSYGDLNLRAIEDRLGKAIKQLRRSGQDYPGLARIIVLSFVSDIYITQASEVIPFNGLQFKAKSLWCRVDSLLKRNSDLSAIAVMYQQSPPRFSVYHNPACVDVESLSLEVFNDDLSVQFDSFETIPRAKCEPFNFHKFTARILETAHSEEQGPITLQDYEALKRHKMSRTE